jgi:hypothetical protein
MVSLAHRGHSSQENTGGPAMTRRQKQILERLCVDGDLSEADLKTSNAYMRENFYFKSPRLADGYFRKGSMPNAPQHRFWRITEAGRDALGEEE